MLKKTNLPADLSAEARAKVEAQAEAGRRYAYKQVNKLYAERLSLLPPYLFVEIDRKTKELKEKGVKIINLGVGDPDLPTPEHIVKSGQEALANPIHQRYPFGAGLKEFRQAVAKWYKQRFAVDLDPDNEVHSLIGSKEGIGHLPLAFVNPGDVVLVPEPGYPVYRASTIFAGGVPYYLPLKEENNFLPDLTKIPAKILKKTKLFFLNYPNNPTTACANEIFFREVINFAKKYQVIVAHDAAYSEIYFPSEVAAGFSPPLSFLSIPGAKDVGIEFHSLSKTYNMTGWRIGFVVGNKKIIHGLATVKDNFDSGVFSAIQMAAVTALTGPQDCVEEIREVYRERRDIFVEGLQKLGWQLRKPEATFYLWAKVPKRYTSLQCVKKLLDKAGIISTPGSGMGPSGEGYVRFALTVDKEQLKEALERIKKVKW